MKETVSGKRLKNRIIGEMAPEDCPQAARLLAECLSDPWTEQALRDACGRDDYLQLIVKDFRHSLIGYAGMKTVLDEGDITNVCIDPDCRREGAGAALMKTLCDLSDQRGIRKIYLEVRVSNEPAIGLYRKAGFREAGIRKGFYDRPKEDALLMMREKGRNHA